MSSLVGGAGSTAGQGGCTCRVAVGSWFHNLATTQRKRASVRLDVSSSGPLRPLTPPPRSGFVQFKTVDEAARTSCTASDRSWRRIRATSGRRVAMVSRARRLTSRLMGFSFLPRRRGSPSPGPDAGAGRHWPLEVSAPSHCRPARAHRRCRPSASASWRAPARAVPWAVSSPPARRHSAEQ
jgi:hypothetical protein